MKPTGPTIREAARNRRPLGGPDAQALEGALQQVERELAGAVSLLRRVFATTKHFSECTCVTCEDARAFLSASAGQEAAKPREGKVPESPPVGPPRAPTPAPEDPNP